MTGEPAVAEKVEGLEEFLQQARSGDREAFEQLIRLFEKNVMRTALYLTRNLDDARDVAQEVYIKILRHLDEYKEAGKVDRWIYRIALNAARDFLRKKKFWLPLKGAVSVVPDDPVHSEEIRNRLMIALEDLSFQERAAFIFKELHEIDTAEVAAIMGCTENTVRAYLHIAKRKLQKHFHDFREDQ